MTRKAISKSMREKVYKKYDGHCAYCGCELTMKTMQVDHVTPFFFDEYYDLKSEETKEKLQLDGDFQLESFDNYMPACRSCNFYKSTFTLEKFRKRIEHILDVLERDSVPYRIGKRYGMINENKEPIKFYFEKVEEEKHDK